MDSFSKNFDKVYRDYYQKVFLFIYSISANRPLAEDITQDAFIKAHRNIGSLRDATRLPAWLNKIAYNLFLDYQRGRDKDILPLANSLAERLADLKKDIALEADQQIMTECIQEKLLQLPESYRTALMLDAQGYGNRDKSEIMGCSLGNAKVRLHRARLKMKEILGQNCTFYYDERNVLC